MIIAKYRNLKGIVPPATTSSFDILYSEILYTEIIESIPLSHGR